ncbi:MAG: NADH dehydrogenase [Candidatus Riflebacteria bacterium RBG_13_59_9]|nr:MAG: NADH dehydrogenase [Candidatus Riflebacteria bacterium RBG_13_59_9]
MSSIESFEHLRLLQDEHRKELEAYPLVISICQGTACRAQGGEEVAEAFEKLLMGTTDIRFVKSGCQGFCERGPLSIVRPSNVFYQMLKPRDVTEIMQKTVDRGEVIDRLLYAHPMTGAKVGKEEEIEFYSRQHRIVLGLNGHIDPLRIQDYFAYNGYSALAKALQTMEPGQIIEEMIEANLRGRGGAGYPTGLKWKSCREAPGDHHYIICNADEGDPGAYMDRSLIEGNPHAIIEGMLIGAFAVGGHEGYIYIRHEYPLAVRTFDRALDQAREYGLLGKNILGTGFDFDIEIAAGAGAFVCGEETGLIASIEGVCGEPRERPPFPAQKGLWENPTNINNVETWANVPHIINKGAKWFRDIGTKESAGTKVFSLVGKVNNTGLIEVPMGMTLREIIFDIGGGIKGDKKFKAVQTGGPSGGMLSEAQLDLPVDFDELTKAGSMMGSGGMIVMDEKTCVVDVAKYFIDFLIDESCGKCLPCREGLRQMSKMLHRICDGDGALKDVNDLEKLAETVAATALCGLGKTAPNPVLSSMKYLRDEYLAHIVEHRCPGGVCKSMISYHVTPDLCTGCGSCDKVCSVSAIQTVHGQKRENGLLRIVDVALCDKCGACIEICPEEAIAKRSPAMVSARAAKS